MSISSWNLLKMNSCAVKSAMAMIPGSQKKRLFRKKFLSFLRGRGSGISLAISLFA